MKTYPTLTASAIREMSAEDRGTTDEVLSRYALDRARTRDHDQKISERARGFCSGASCTIFNRLENYYVDRETNVIND